MQWSLLWLSFIDFQPKTAAFMGITIDVSCVLYSDLSSRDHIFFGCEISKDIWNEVLLLSKLHKGVDSWGEEEVHWAVSMRKGKALISIILRLAWNALIYQGWREKNMLFGQT